MQEKRLWFRNTRNVHSPQDDAPCYAVTDKGSGTIPEGTGAGCWNEVFRFGKVRDDKWYQDNVIGKTKFDVLHSIIPKRETVTKEAFVLYDPQAKDSVVEHETTDDQRHAYDRLLIFQTAAGAAQYSKESDSAPRADDGIAGRAVPRKARITIELEPEE